MLVRFPFSDLSRSKLRPAVVLADAGRGDYLLCSITSKPYGDASVICLDEVAFASGFPSRHELRQTGKLFTASSDLVARRVGALTAEAHDRIVNAVVALIRGDPRSPSPPGRT